MASSFKPKKGGNETLIRMEIASGVVIALDDHVINSGGQAVKATGATDNLAFRGVARGQHGSADPSGSILVSLPNAQAVYEVELDSATTVAFGDNLQLSGKDKLLKSDTDPVAVAMESKLLATRINVMYKLVSVTSGFLSIGDAS